MLLRFHLCIVVQYLVVEEDSESQDDEVSCEHAFDDSFDLGRVYPPLWAAGSETLREVVIHVIQEDRLHGEHEAGHHLGEVDHPREGP